MSTSSAGKYYVVWKGRRPGVYTTWAECAAQVQGYPDARFKAFPTREMAERAFRLGPKAAEMPMWTLAQPGPQVPSIAVDAAASQARGAVLYQGVLLLPKGNTQRLFQERLRHGTVPIGEFVALVRGLQWLEEHHRNLPLYTDSQTAWQWFQKGGPKETTLSRLPLETQERVRQLLTWLREHPGPWDVRLWETRQWGENPADFGRK